jgi:hypothetical protein
MFSSHRDGNLSGLLRAPGRLATLLLTASVLALPGCYTIYHKQANEWSAYSKESSIRRENAKKFMDKLLFDPEFSLIRGKSGISLTACPIDRSDNNYPTDAERNAIRNFIVLLAEAGNNEIPPISSVSSSYLPPGTARIAILRLQAHLDSVRMLENKRLTWRQFGETCAKIQADYPLGSAKLSLTTSTSMQYIAQKNEAELEQARHEYERFQNQIDDIVRNTQR